MKGMEFKSQRYRLAIVLRSFFFPITSPEIIDSLKKRGYSINFPPVSIPTGARAYIGGPIASKKDCIVELNPERKILASEGTSNEDVITVLKELIVIMKENFNINLDEEIDYLELTADIDISSERDPIKIIEGVFEDNKCIKKFDKILEAKTSLFSVDITPKDMSPASKKWFHIKIQPRVTMPRQVYYIHVVCRDENVDTVFNFTREVKSKTLNLIKEIEVG